MKLIKANKNIHKTVMLYLEKHEQLSKKEKDVIIDYIRLMSKTEHSIATTRLPDTDNLVNLSPGKII